MAESSAPPGMDQVLLNDLVLCVAQYLNEEGFGDALHALERESGVFFNLAFFDSRLMAGAWEECEKYLSGFTEPMQNPFSKKIYFSIRKQKYLEALDRQDRGAAVDILVRELRAFQAVNVELYRELTSLLTLDNFRQHEKLTSYGNDVRVQRAIVAQEVRGLLEINPATAAKLTFPAMQHSRLRVLINQSLQWQHGKCPPGAPIPPVTTLLLDHTCVPRQLAGETAPAASSGWTGGVAGGGRGRSPRGRRQFHGAGEDDSGGRGSGGVSAGRGGDSKPTTKRARRPTAAGDSADGAGPACDWVSESTVDPGIRHREAVHVNDANVEASLRAIHLLLITAGATVAADCCPTSLAFHPSVPGLLAVGDAGGHVQLWDVTTGTRMFHQPYLSVSLPACPSGVSHIAWSPPVVAGRAFLAAGFGHRLLQVWAVAAGAPPTPLRHLEIVAHDGAIVALGFMPFGRGKTAMGPKVTPGDPPPCLMVSAGGDGAVRLWNAATGVALGMLAEPGPGLRSTLPYAPFDHPAASLVLTTTNQGAIMTCAVTTDVPTPAPVLTCQLAADALGAAWLPISRRLFVLAAPPRASPQLMELAADGRGPPMIHALPLSEQIGDARVWIAAAPPGAAIRGEILMIGDARGVHMLSIAPAAGAPVTRVALHRDPISGGCPVASVSCDGSALAIAAAPGASIPGVRITVRPSHPALPVVASLHPHSPSHAHATASAPAPPVLLTAAASRPTPTGKLSAMIHVLVAPTASPAVALAIGPAVAPEAGHVMMVLTQDGRHRKYTWTVGAATTGGPPWIESPFAPITETVPPVGASHESTAPPPCCCLALSASGQYMLSGSGAGASLYAMAPPTALAYVMGPPDAETAVLAAAFHPRDANRLALGLASGMTRLYDVRGATVAAELMGGHVWGGGVTSLSFTTLGRWGDGLITAADGDPALCLWATHGAGHLLARCVLPGPAAGWVNPRVTHGQVRDCILVATTGGSDGMVCMCVLGETAEEGTPVTPPLAVTANWHPASGAVAAVALSCDEEIVLAVLDDAVNLLLLSRHLMPLCRLTLPRPMHALDAVAHPATPLHFALALNDGSILVLMPAVAVAAQPGEPGALDWMTIPPDLA